MRTGATVAVLVLVVLSGCVAPAAPDSADGEPTSTELSFADVADEAGLTYSSVEGGAGNGNDGLYVADYDDDLREDVLAIGGESPTLFRNVVGAFEPSGALPDLADVGRVQGALWLDHDNDGREDLLLLVRGGVPVFLENDAGRFERRDVGFETAFDNPVGATAADYDGDGCLDLFVVQYGLWSEATPEAWNDQFFESDNGNPNALYRGHCGDGFERVAPDEAGVGPTEDGPHWSLAASFTDLTGDGHPDVHVANDYYNDTVYYNRGDGTFERSSLGEATDRNGMSSEVADLTGDGRPEVLVTNIYFPRDRIGDLEPTDRRLFSNFLANRLGKRLKGNNLLVPTEDGFEDRGRDVGLAEGGWGWAAVAADLDSDGDRDVFHGTQDVVQFDDDDPVFSLPMAWVGHDGEFHRQDGGGIGLSPSDDRGVVRLDYDLDGALDLGVATYDEPYLLYRNGAPQGNSLQVVVDAGDANRTALGAELTATVDGETRHFRHSARADYQSQDSRVLHVGLGDAARAGELRIAWPDGTERVLEDVAAGQRIRVTPDGIEERRQYND